MKEFSFRQEPFRVFGVPFFEKNGRLERLPEELRQQLPNLSFLGRRCPGARLCFRTDSKNVQIKLTFETLSMDAGMSIYSCQSAYIYFGPHSTSYYAGLVNPSDYNAKVAVCNFEKSGEIEDVTVFLPRNEIIADITVGLDDGAQLLPPTPYKHSLPIVYYGSSITECGCCSKTSNAYSALISRWLDVDYYNFGFSGNAKGEPEMADYINTVEKSVFVLDYDHNAPTVKYLEQTHEPFFKRIRAVSPDLPVVMMTMPDFGTEKTAQQRRQVIRKTYDNAVAAGDKNVYFVDGGTFFSPEEVHACTIDTIHPNDLGFYRMAQKLAPIIEKLL